MVETKQDLKLHKVPRGKHHMGDPLIYENYMSNPDFNKYNKKYKGVDPNSMHVPLENLSPRKGGLY